MVVALCFISCHFFSSFVGAGCLQIYQRGHGPKVWSFLARFGRRRFWISDYSPAKANVVLDSCKRWRVNIQVLDQAAVVRVYTKSEEEQEETQIHDIN